MMLEARSKHPELDSTHPHMQQALPTPLGEKTLP